MSVGDRLDALRAEVPECRLAAFADIRTSLVLRVSSDLNWTQEKLDALCRQASDLLDGTMSRSVTQAFDLNRITPQAIAVTPSDMRLFVRAAGEESDVLCCVCDGAADARAMAMAARAALREIVGEN